MLPYFSLRDISRNTSMSWHFWKYCLLYLLLPLQLEKFPGELFSSLKEMRFFFPLPFFALSSWKLRAKDQINQESEYLLQVIFLFSYSSLSPSLEFTFLRQTLPGLNILTHLPCSNFWLQLNRIGLIIIFFFILFLYFSPLFLYCKASCSTANPLWNGARYK